jgi:hypothetical protein
VPFFKRVICVSAVYPYTAQLSLFSCGAANKADFICMAADGIALLAGDVSFSEEGDSFLELHPEQTAIAVRNKRKTFM